MYSVSRLDTTIHPSLTEVRAINLQCSCLKSRPVKNLFKDT